MVCSQCGAYSDSNKKYCSVCGAPMPEPDIEYDSYGEPPALQQEGTRPGQQPRGFVRAPKWPKPNFDINALDELPAQEDSLQQPQFDEDADYKKNFAPRPATPHRFTPQPVSPKPPSYSTEPLKPYASVGGYEDAEPRSAQSSFGRAPQRSTVYSMDDEEDRGFPPTPSRKRAAAPPPQSAPARKAPATQGQARKRSARGGTGNNSLLFFGIVGLLVVLLLVFGTILINKNYGSIGGFFNSVFGKSPILKEAVVTSGTDANGTECYIVTVYAQEGTLVTMRIPNSSGTAPYENSGKMTSKKFMDLFFPKSLMLPSEPMDAVTAQIVPDIRITTLDGEEFPVEVAPITVDVPLLDFAVTSPATESISVNTNVVTLAGSTAPGAQVLLDGQLLPVADDGTFSVEYPLPGQDVYTLNLEARKNGYQIARKSIQVTFTQSVALVTIDKSTVRAVNDTVTLKGHTDPGATMTVTGPSGVELSTPTVNASGDFTFTAKLPEAGGFELSGTVTSTDGLVTTVPIFIERAPDKDTYTASVYKMDYDRMVKEPTHSGKYKCIGKVTEVITTEPYIIAKLTTSEGKEMLFEYHNTAASVEANDGKTYNLYADFKGIDQESGLPIVYCWYIIKNG